MQLSIYLVKNKLLQTPSAVDGRPPGRFFSVLENDNCGQLATERRVVNVILFG